MRHSALPRIFSALKLSRRGQPSISGKFTYVNYDTGLSRTFVWDEAGIDPTGGIVLIEEEINGIIPLHIEGHIARLRVMAVKGECISKVIWTIRDADFDEMCGLLRFYRGSIDSLPAMEIWSEGGVRLGVA